MKMPKDGGEKPKRQMIYTQKFRKEWLKIPEFEPWLEEIPGNPTKALCKFCQRHLNARMNDLKKHCQCKKHILVANRLISGSSKGSSAANGNVSDDDMDIPSERFLKILRDISSIEEYKIGGSQGSSYETSWREGDIGRHSNDGITQLAKAQSETNTLLHALINVQKERLSVEKERLETEKLRLSVEEGILAVLNSKLTVTAADC